MEKKRKDMPIRVIIAIVALTGLMLASGAGAATFQLAKGTELKVKLYSETAVNSKTVAAGDTLMITLAEPLMMGDQELIASGAPGRAVVAEIEKPKAPGKPGRIAVQFIEMATRGAYHTADGAPIKLEGQVEKVGKGKKTLAYITIVGIFLIKGGQGEIPLDSAYTAQVAERTVLTDD